MELRELRGDGINIHFTGCPFSCAQSYIGDIGLLGLKSKSGPVYHVYVGGTTDWNRTAALVRKAVPATQLFYYVADIIQHFEERRRCGESFHAYVGRVGVREASLQREDGNV